MDYVGIDSSYKLSLMCPLLHADVELVFRLLVLTQLEDGNSLGMNWDMCLKLLRYYLFRQKRVTLYFEHVYTMSLIAE